MDCTNPKNRNKKVCKAKLKTASEQVWDMLGFQYKSRDKLIKENLPPKALKKYQKFSKARKIALIDSLEAKGMFEEYGY